MLHLLMTPSAARTARRLAGTVADAVRSVVAPAALVKATATPVDAALAAEPTDLYTADDMPPLADIERAALSYDLATDAARAADRAKRKAKKVLDRLPAGRYGAWIVERVASNRQTVDLEAVRRIFAEHNLGPVPMRTPAPSLRVTPAPTEAAAAAAEVEVRELVTA